MALDCIAQLFLLLMGRAFRTCFVALQGNSERQNFVNDGELWPSENCVSDI